MILIVGLGNPGKKYEKTRHNIGARVVGELEDLGLKDVILTKPTTFMNDSGKAVKKLNTKYKIQNTNLWVIHDDLDLPLGKLRISLGRGSAGHKGVQSIIRELKTKDFVRFRVGIGQFAQNKKIDNFVLGKFTSAEEKVVKKVVQKTCQALEFALKQGLQKAMNKYNG